MTQQTETPIDLSRPRASDGTKSPSFLRSFAYWHELVLAVLLVGLMIVAWRIDPSFVSSGTQLELLTQVLEISLLALPMTLVIITAGIDLSVGSIMALSAVALGMSYQAHWPLGVGIALALITGVACGALNGIFVSYVKVHPLIVTLATLSAYRGIAEGISHAEPVSGFPESFAWIGQGTIAGLPVPAIMFILFAIVCAVVLAKTPLGRAIYAIGFNETAVRFSGINIARIKLMLYTFAGAMSGLAAIVFVSRRNTAKADVGSGIELDVITAVVLGGTSIFGGRGNIVGTVLGILLIHETRQFVSWQWQSDELILIVIGALLIASVLLNTLLTRRRRS
ncbi:MAG TPA: ABC transporter permease [Tepidisphaeraceae bacterium]|jgi:rhamnose transport system permease protein|nr:ABC transporter permease [Tepidisphaeraceae bacterium]